MLIKEYHIPIPLTVEEYRIAQLYMIAKKSREETSGTESGVEILVNEPYENGPEGTTGQYTHKVYHVGRHIPGWLKAILPKSLLSVEEKAWNAYPYTKTHYSCPFVGDKFFIEIETKYFNDNGHQDNVFSLQGDDLKNRELDVIDIVKDKLYGADYLQEEDPTEYVSAKTGRGPLTEDWVDEYWAATKDTGGSTPDGKKSIMTAYKLCKVEFRYWGFQTRTERFIHDSALRKTMVRAHKQAWCWQDEWVGLTMADIRTMEKEIQQQLAEKLAAARGEAEDGPKESSEAGAAAAASAKGDIAKSPSEDEFFDAT